MEDGTLQSDPTPAIPCGFKTVDTDYSRPLKPYLAKIEDEESGKTKYQFQIDLNTPAESNFAPHPSSLLDQRRDM